MLEVIDNSMVDLAALPSQLASVDVSEFGEAQLASLLAGVRSAQRCLDGLVIRIAVRSNQLAGAGRSAPAAEALRGDGAVASAQARRESNRATTADAVVGLADAVSTGATSGEHVDAIARHTARLTDEQRHGLDFADLVEQSKRLPPETFDRLIKRLVDDLIADQGLGETQRQQEASEFRHWFDQKLGLGRFSGALDPERYEALTGAIDRHVASIAAASAEHRITKSANLAAQALVELVLLPRGGRGSAALPSVTVVVDHETLAGRPHARSLRQTESGHDLAAASVARLCCDAVIRRVTLDENGIPINVGRKYRTATDAQWAALKAIHSTCGWDGCRAPIGWCQAHHVHEWERGGPTNLDNLVPLCSQHHHRVHEGGWRIALAAGRSLAIHKPDWSYHTTVPPPHRC